MMISINLITVDDKYSLRSAGRQESITPFGYMKKRYHSLSKRVPEIHENFMKIGLLLDNHTLRSFSAKEIVNYCHNVSRASF